MLNKHTFSKFQTKQHFKMSKRAAEESSSGQPPIKRVQFEPHLIGPVSTLEEMDIKVLQFQNKKLAQVLVFNVTLHLVINSIFFYCRELSNGIAWKPNYVKELSN